MRDAIVLGEGDLLDHLPGDGLEAGQRQQDLSKPEPSSSIIAATAGRFFLSK
jgi:hypothetical protein